MKSINIDTDHLKVLLRKIHLHSTGGKLPDYIPAPQEVDPKLFSCTIFHDGQLSSAGSSDIPFTLQSIS